MNRDQKAAFIAEVAEQIRTAGAIYAVDYRGLSVQQSTQLRSQLHESGATFRVVKNRLTKLAADQAEIDSLKELLEGPTALCFVSEGGDPALAAKAIATFRRQHQLPQFKGGALDGRVLSSQDVESIAQLPSRDVLQGRFVATLASPLTGLVRGLNSLVSGLALQLQQIHDQGLVGGGEVSSAPQGDQPTEQAPQTADSSGEADDESDKSGDDEAGDESGG